MYSALKRVLVGSPIATSEEHHTRLPKKVALPVFASDAISSTAYAPQEILIKPGELEDVTIGPSLGVGDGRTRAHDEGPIAALSQK